jgi:hypothetical protein
MKEKLKRLPAQIKYKLPTFATGLKHDKEEYNKKLWSEEIDTYSLDIWKTKEGNWVVAYVRHDPYEGGVDVLLPARPEKEVLENIKKAWSLEEGENIRWLIGMEDLYQSTESTDLEDAIDKVLQWLEKEGLLE